MSLLLPHAEGAANSSKQSKIWIGDGLPAIPKRLHDQMINWEFVDLVELVEQFTLYLVTPQLNIPPLKYNPMVRQFTIMKSHHDDSTPHTSHNQLDTPPSETKPLG